MGGSARARKVLLAEFNEITWRFIEPLCARGKLPAFSEFVRCGTKGSPLATEVPPHLDPWIAWTSVYTGRPQEEHGVRFLEQPPETVRGPKLWDIAADEGKSLGVFGSIMSWPPRHDIRGFWVPSTFSPTTATHPKALEPIQELNLGQTRGHTPLHPQSPSKWSPASLYRLLRLGLRPATLAQIASYLVRSRITPHRHWEKVSLQPAVNLDFFEKLYKEHRPDLATFHTNHVAHYMHRYWRSADPAPFLTKPTETEVKHYGGAVEFGYQTADRVLRRLWKLADEQTIVILASGLGQQPYVDEGFRDGRQVVRIRNIQQIVRLCGVEGHCHAISMMAPQWNLQFDDSAMLQRAKEALDGAWVGSPDVKLFAHEVVGNTINFNVCQKNFKTFDLEACCVFPEANGARMKLGELCAAQDATPKQGYHDPVGMVLLRGPGIRQGAELHDCTNLDLAPTILHLLGLEVPGYMRGRVLEEAFEGNASVSVASMA
jgi:hypothetical protein